MEVKGVAGCAIRLDHLVALAFQNRQDIASIEVEVFSRLRSGHGHESGEHVHKADGCFGIQSPLRHSRASDDEWNPDSALFERELAAIKGAVVGDRFLDAFALAVFDRRP